MTNLLVPLAWAYRAGVALRNKAFDLNLISPVQFGVPVISVGNIVVGGVGKTPLVEYVADYCRSKGKKTAIVSRGYKRKSSGMMVVSDGKSLLLTARDGGDEPVQMAVRFPDVIVVVAEKRVKAVHKAIDLGAEVVVADDCFQHRYVARDLNILVLDGRDDLRGKRLLPAGNLREPLTEIRRADLIALSRATDTEQLPSWAADLLKGFAGSVVRFRYRGGSLIRATDQTTLDDKEVRSLGLLAFSGIGNHEQFLSTIRDRGLGVVAEIGFSDHHRYSSADIRRIKAVMEESGAQGCVTTEKDSFRMHDQQEEISRFFREQNVFVLPISVEFIEGESSLRRRIDECIAAGVERRAKSIEHGA